MASAGFTTLPSHLAAYCDRSEQTMKNKLCPHGQQFVCIECRNAGKRPPGATLSDTEAMVRIHALLDGTEWDSDTASDIAEVLRETGRTIREPA